MALILKKTILFVLFSGIVVFLNAYFNFISNFHLWIEIGLWELGVFVFTQLIPHFFKSPIWPHLYKSSIRLLGSASIFVYFYFFKYPSETACAWIICIYYFLFIFTELSIEIMKEKKINKQTA